MRIRVQLRAVLLLAAPALGLSQSLTLGGNIIDGLTNQPLAGIRVHLYEWAAGDFGPVGRHGPAAAPVTSDAEGHFAFTHLTSGEYSLQAELPHEVYTYGESVDLRRWNTIHVGPESEGQEIPFRILPRATIKGTVRDEQGEILENAGVDFYRRDRRGGRIELMFAGWTGLDARGRYTIAGLWPGDYVVCAEPPKPWLAYFVPSSGSDVAYRPGGESRVYTETCYPDPKSPKGTLLHISPGARQNLDLTVGSAPSVTLRTNLNAALLRPDLPRLAPVSASDTTDPPSERWRIRNVPPGNYVLYALTGDGQGYAVDPGSVVRQPVTVTSKPAVLELHPEKRGRVDIHLYSNDGRTLSRDAATVSFIHSASLTVIDHYGLTGLSYTFDPGDYWLSIRPKPPLCVNAQTLAGGNLLNGKVTVTPGMSAELDLVLGANCGTIDILTVSSGTRVSFANYLLMLNGTPEEPGDVVTGNTDAHGHASIPRIPPGRYMLWAWVPNGDGYLGPDLAGAAAQAVEVVVAADRVAPVAIDPIRSPGVSR